MRIATTSPDRDADSFPATPVAVPAAGSEQRDRFSTQTYGASPGPRILALHGVFLAAITAATEVQPPANSQPGRLVFGPVGTLFPEYVADPRRPQTAMGIMLAMNSDLVDDTDTGNSRFDLRLGERYRMLRWHASETVAVELAAEAAFFGQFDHKHNLDNIGWDGWYGANIALRYHDAWSFKLAYRHLSSHLGDEFEERTGQRRTGYTREDLTAAMAWSAADWTAYGEVGTAVHLSRSDQDHGFAEVGIQTRTAQPVLFERFGWLAGIDLQVFEETDWDPNLNLTAGILLPAHRQGEALRLALEFYTGRALIGEFNRYDEDYVTMVIGWDF